MAQKEIARKITIATIAGKASVWFGKCMELKGQPLLLARIYGTVTGYTAGATEYGEFVKFRGQVRAVNLETGEQQDAPQVILPTHVAEMLRSALEAGGQAVQFALTVSVKFDVTSAVKYVYVVENALPPAQNDPMAAIEAAMNAQLALENNATETADAPAPAPAPAPTASGGKRK